MENLVCFASLQARCAVNLCVGSQDSAHLAAQRCLVAFHHDSLQHLLNLWVSFMSYIASTTPGWMPDTQAKSDAIRQLYLANRIDLNEV